MPKPLSIAAAVLSVSLVGSAQTDVDVTTANGMRFAAQWTDAGENAPAALLFPMCWEMPPETWSPVAAALKSRGVSSLVITYPGWRGNSPWPGSQPPPEPRQEYWDAQFRHVGEAAFAFVRTRTARPMVIGGSSCGATHGMDVAMRHPDDVAGLVVFAGAHSPAHLAYVKAGRVPVLAPTSRGDNPWPEQHQLLVAASGDQASRLLIREEGGHGTALLKGRPEFAAEIAEWVAARLVRAP
jgi:hypothetical protein